MVRKYKSGKSKSCDACIAKKKITSRLELCCDKFNGACRWFMAIYHVYRGTEVIKSLIEAFSNLN